MLTALLLFAAATAIVLTGTLYPMIYGLMGWGKISVGPPYFNMALLPFGILGLLLLCIGGGLCGRLSVKLAHFGVLIVAVGIACSSLYRQEISQNIVVGESVELAGYRFSFQKINLLVKANYTAEQAIIRIARGTKEIAHIKPEIRYYSARRQQMMEPGIYWDGIRDWYVVMGEKTGDNRYAIRFYVQAGVRWIWLGAGFIISGALLGWYQRRKVCCALC